MAVTIAVLDERYSKVETQDSQDHNNYALGRIGGGIPCPEKNIGIGLGDVVISHVLDPLNYSLSKIVVVGRCMRGVWW
jgi:hypothetical protein